MVTMGAFLLVALALLALRERRLALTSESVKIHAQIVARQQSLWDERVQIARRTNPWALAAGLQKAGMNAGDVMDPTDTVTARASAGAARAAPAVETDLTAAVREDGTGHVNAERPQP